MKGKVMIKELTFSEFLKKFRPDGVGITIVYTPKKTEIIEFREVICDFCNAEITPKKLCNTCNETGKVNNEKCCKCKGSGYSDKENNVYLIYSNGVCEKCAVNMMRREKLSIKQSRISHE